MADPVRDSQTQCHTRVRETRESPRSPQQCTHRPPRGKTFCKISAEVILPRHPAVSRLTPSTRSLSHPGAQSAGEKPPASRRDRPGINKPEIKSELGHHAPDGGGLDRAGHTPRKRKSSLQSRRAVEHI